MIAQQNLRSRGAHFHANAGPFPYSSAWGKRITHIPFAREKKPAIAWLRRRAGKLNKDCKPPPRHRLAKVC